VKLQGGLVSVQGTPADDMERLLSIGEFARRSRLSPRALRLYDAHGILVPARVDSNSGYRRYAEGQLSVARLVAQLRRLEMPLDRIAEVLAVPTAQGADLVAVYWEGVERRAASQRELAKHVRAQLTGDRHALGFPAPQVRAVAAQTVLTERRYTTIGGLPGVTLDSCTRLMAIADRYGARAGEFSFLYHGEVSEDSDGPVELCLPVEPEAADRVGLLTRVEPAHEEVFVRLTKAQTEYPQILSAYDTLFAWAAEHGKQRRAAPREVYLSFFPSAAPDEQVCDVALPIG
jgi:DNA-binding transcriptional MerR regulator